MFQGDAQELPRNREDILTLRCCHHYETSQQVKHLKPFVQHILRYVATSMASTELPVHSKKLKFWDVNFEASWLDLGAKVGSFLYGPHSTSVTCTHFLLLWEKRISSLFQNFGKFVSSRKGTGREVISYSVGLWRLPWRHCTLSCFSILPDIYWLLPKTMPQWFQNLSCLLATSAD